MGEELSRFWLENGPCCFSLVALVYPSLLFGLLATFLIRWRRAARRERAMHLIAVLCWGLSAPLALVENYRARERAAEPASLFEDRFGFPPPLSVRFLRTEYVPRWQDIGTKLEFVADRETIQRILADPRRAWAPGRGHWSLSLPGEREGFACAKNAVAFHTEEESSHHAMICIVESSGRVAFEDADVF